MRHILFCSLAIWMLAACDDSANTADNTGNVNNVNNTGNTTGINNTNNTNSTNNVNNTTSTCGDGLVEGLEVCDGTDLNGATCESRGFGPGTLSCAADCTGWDTSACGDPVSCDVTDPLAGAPAFTMPSTEEWNHSIITGATVASGSPYHMIHDEMAAPSETIALRAKFDYNAVFHKDLQDEVVIFYLWGGAMTSWQELGRYLTDSDGMVHLTVDPLPVGTYIVRAVVPGDLSTAEGYITVVNPGRKAVIFDIDGTLTTSDSEVMQDWANFSTAEMYPYADEVVAYYVELGYQIVMVTGRPYWLADDTRAWLADRGMPVSSVRFTSDNGTTISGEETQAYKTEYLDDLVTRCGLTLTRAYGNATTDIGAYDAVGVPKSETFIIGENAGAENTQPVICEGCGYQDHYESFLLTEDLPCGLPQ